MIRITDPLEAKQVGSYIYNPDRDILGKGAFATVYKGYDTANNSRLVAIKVIPNTILFNSEEQYTRIMREVQILQQIKSPYIVQLLDSKRTANNLYLITEYCNGGDLEKYLKKYKSLSEEEALSIIKQIAQAFMNLQNIEGVTIMHRDIKPANILFDNGLIKLADFGFAKMVCDDTKDTQERHTLLGTPYYMNPQTLSNDKYSIKCDIWSTGFVFYECLFGKTPWTGATIPGLLKNIKTVPLTFPNEKLISEETKDLIKKMLKYNEEERIDWKDVWNHAAMQKIKLKSEIEKVKVPIQIEKAKSFSEAEKANVYHEVENKKNQVIIMQIDQTQTQTQCIIPKAPYNITNTTSNPTNTRNKIYVIPTSASATKRSDSKPKENIPQPLISRPNNQQQNVISITTHPIPIHPTAGYFQQVRVQTNQDLPVLTIHSRNTRSSSSSRLHLNITPID